VEISGDIARSRYTKTIYNWSIQIARGHYRIVETHIHMNMVIHLYEYGKGWEFVYIQKEELEKGSCRWKRRMGIRAHQEAP